MPSKIAELNSEDDGISSNALSWDAVKDSINPKRKKGGKTSIKNIWLPSLCNVNGWLLFTGACDFLRIFPRYLRRLNSDPKHVTSYTQTADEMRKFPIKEFHLANCSSTKSETAHLNINFRTHHIIRIPATSDRVFPDDGPSTFRSVSPVAGRQDDEQKGKENTIRNGPELLLTPHPNPGSVTTCRSSLGTHPPPHHTHTHTLTSWAEKKVTVKARWIIQEDPKGIFISFLI